MNIEIVAVVASARVQGGDQLSTPTAAIEAPRTETIGLYLTKSGKEGARVQRTVHANGRVSHSWTGEWGAGSGSLEGIRSSLESTLKHKRGYQTIIKVA
ncbi:hypothetical protein [Paraburkholderia sp. SIMBA_054]|uniref:hypothetical protein n=1 Tax=Paraburkholderia sp. SIMBA_054 TaxID=3085795 RepID=UPI00397AA006